MPQYDGGMHCLLARHFACDFFYNCSQLYEARRVHDLLEEAQAPKLNICKISHTKVFSGLQDTITRKDHQLSPTNPRDALHHGERAGAFNLHHLHLAPLFG